MAREDIHDYKGSLDVITRRIEASDMPAGTKASILRFRQQCIAKGLSSGRVLRYMFDLLKLHDWNGGDLRGADRDKITALVARIEESDYAPLTKRDLKITLRKYVQFVKGTATVPAIVAWVKPSAGVRRSKLPEELLTPDEVGRMIRIATNPRDRAFIATAYESGSRIGEILGLRIRHVRPLDVGAQLHVDGKTGPRRIRVISSAPYLTELLNAHPRGDDGDASLWMTYRGETLGYAGAAKLMRTLARRAGVKKRIYPHLFRHSRATHLANHLTEAQMKEYFGWVQDSGMAAVYVHLSGRDVDEAILRLHGIATKPANDGAVLSPRTCLRCHSENPATHRFCMLCGHPLDEIAAREILQSELDRKEADSTLDDIIDDPEVKEMLRRKIRERRGVIQR